MTDPDRRQQWLAAIERSAPWLLAVYLLILFAATHYPQDLLAAAPVIGVDKVLHLAAYAVVAALVTMQLRGRGVAATIALAVLITVAIGVLDEFTQPFFNRMCDPFDLLADCVGAAFGSWAWLSIRRKSGGAAQQA